MSENTLEKEFELIDEKTHEPELCCDNDDCSRTIFQMIVLKKVKLPLNLNFLKDKLSERMVKEGNLPKEIDNKISELNSYKNSFGILRAKLCENSNEKFRDKVL